MCANSDMKADHEIMLNIIERVENHMKFEKHRVQRSFLSSRINECKEPTPSNEFEAARLILSHFSFLTYEALQVLINN